MKRTPLFIVIAAFASAPAWAGNDSSQSQSDQQSAPQAQASQSGPQTPSSDTVKQAQQKLSQAGYDVGSADGVMGPKTQDAIKQLQQDKQLNATGELDQETLAALGVNEENSSTGSSSTGSSSTGSPSSSGASSSDSSSANPSSGDSSSSQNATGSSGGDSANGGASQSSGASQ